MLIICLYLSIIFTILSGCSGKPGPAKASAESLGEESTVVELPEIDENVTTEQALKLCLYYGLNHLAKRIEDTSNLYKEWVFDGCSMTPTEVLSELIKVPSLKEICLRHDLGYAYGEPGNEEERVKVDKKFQNELLDGGASKFVAKMMFEAVRAGGKEELCFPFSWGFARVASCKLGVGLILE